MFALFVGLMLFQACADDFNRLDFSPSPEPYNISSAVRDTTFNSGLQFYVLEEGSGPFAVVSRDQLQVRYTARTADGQIFNGSYYTQSNSNLAAIPNLTPTPIQSNACRTQNRRCVFPEGFRKGILGMKEGERRTIIVPPSLGYTDDFINSAGRDSENGVNLEGKRLRYDIELVTIL